MKNLIITACMLFYFNAVAQETVKDIKLHGHEFSLNFLDLVTVGSVELQYEKFMPRNQSLQFNATLFETVSYETYDMEENNAHSLSAAYRFYMGKKDHAGIFFFPYAKYMFGTQQHNDLYWYNETTGESGVDSFEVDMNNLSLGFGLGYKWVFADRYSLGLDATLGRNFSKEVQDIFAEVDVKGGVNFGIRF